MCQKTRLSEAIAEFTSFSAGRKTALQMSTLAGGETFYGTIMEASYLQMGDGGAHTMCVAMCLIAPIWEQWGSCNILMERTQLTTPEICLYYGRGWVAGKRIPAGRFDRVSRGKQR